VQASAGGVVPAVAGADERASRGAAQTAAWKACRWWNTVLVDASHTVAFDQLSGCDLVLDRVYKGGNAGNAADDPLARLLPGVGNQGGFRAMGKAARDAVRLVVLYTSGAEPDWPDELDPYTGAFTYFGDNRSPGRELHDTPRKGNLLLRSVFERAHSGPDGRAKVPPFLLFDKPGTGRDVRFRGLLAPGSDRISGEEDLVAVWRTTKGQRFQNYRARFTVLDASCIGRRWIRELTVGEPLGPCCPPVWRTWVETGNYAPLLAPPTVIIRRRDQQEPLPADKPLIDPGVSAFQGPANRLRAVRRRLVARQPAQRRQDRRHQALARWRTRRSR